MSGALVFVAGLMVGGTLGVFVMSAFAVGSRADEVPALVPDEVKGGADFDRDPEARRRFMDER
jgi:hypothetical protein